jgi:hypothetical protein
MMTHTTWLIAVAAERRPVQIPSPAPFLVCRADGTAVGEALGDWAAELDFGAAVLWPPLEQPVTTRPTATIAEVKAKPRLVMFKRYRHAPPNHDRVCGFLSIPSAIWRCFTHAQRSYRRCTSAVAGTSRKEIYVIQLRTAAVVTGLSATFILGVPIAASAAPASPQTLTCTSTRSTQSLPAIGSSTSVSTQPAANAGSFTVQRTAATTLSVTGTAPSTGWTAKEAIPSGTRVRVDFQSTTSTQVVRVTTHVNTAQTLLDVKRTVCS